MSDIPAKPLPWWKRLTSTQFVAWVTFFYVFVVQGDQMISVLNRRVFGPGKLTVVKCAHVARGGMVDESGEHTADDTDFVDLDFKVVNHSQQTILVDRVEVEVEARGTVPNGAFRTGHLEVSGEYLLALPDLAPGERATRYVVVPHVLKPGDADAFKIILAWPGKVSLTGSYSIKPVLVTSAGTNSLETFEVPVKSDLVPVISDTPE